MTAVCNVFGAVSMSEFIVQSRYFLTGDQVKLHYLEVGSGAPLIMIPGWSQTAAMFKKQLEFFAQHYHCIAIDIESFPCLL